MGIRGTFSSDSVVLRTSDRKEAAHRFEVWNQELNAAIHFGECRLSWQAAVVRYLTEVGPNTIKPGTLTRYRCSLKQIGAHFEGLYLDQIDRKRIADMVSDRRKAAVTNATINRDLTAISAVLAAAQEWGAVERNPAREFGRKTTKERREPIDPPCEADVHAVIERAPGLFSAMIRLMAETGCRQEEAAGLEWRHIDLRSGAITFAKTKTSRPRTIGLEPDTVRWLSTLPRYLGGQAVFWHDGGARYANVASRFREIIKSVEGSAQKVGTKFRPFRCHDLRHKYAIDQLKAGRDIYALSRHLGHSSVKTTEIYLGHVSGGGGTNAGTSTTVIRPVAAGRITEDTADMLCLSMYWRREGYPQRKIRSNFSQFLCWRMAALASGGLKVDVEMFPN
ncbi:MAG: site-specific integrase [Rhodospirillaceae bacterium]